MVRQHAAMPDAANASAPGEAPAFTAEENAVIAVWSEAMQARGLRIEANSRSYESLKEAMLVFPASSSEPAWLLHNTPAGAVAVRWWPGVAEIVSTVPEALAVITAAAGATEG